MLKIKSIKPMFDSLVTTMNKYEQDGFENGVIVKIFKGTDITVMEDIFDHTIRAEYRKKVYSTRQIAGHRQDSVKRQQKIQNQNFEHIEEMYLEKSMELFKSYLCNRYDGLKNTSFLLENYRIIFIRL